MRHESGLLILAVVTMLVAILGQPVALTAQERRPSRFVEEPFKVRLVDRSKLGPGLSPTRVDLATNERPGTIIIDTHGRRLYLVEAGGTAIRFGIGVGSIGRGWTGTVTIGRMSRWPAWYPTDEMRSVAPNIPARIAPGPANPLGARAIYLYSKGQDTLYRIHGTSEPWTIGTEVSSGCFRMLNEDVIMLFDQVAVGGKVIVQ